MNRRLRRARSFAAVTTIAALLFALPASEGIAEEGIGIVAPPGFVVEQFADDALAHDAHALTIDSQGRVVVAGRGYIQTLIDHDDDGRADQAVLFAELPQSGAMGLCFAGNRLLCTGDQGLLLFRDDDEDGRADGPPETLLRFGHSEHGAHAIVQGPDGWFYVLCGNDAGVSAQQIASARSPIKQPRAGALLRLSPDFEQVEIVADGFRNPYDFAFDAAGRIWTVDSDGEREHHLPWYTPTRLFDIAEGESHGWILPGYERSWSQPESFVDNVERAAELGRGSPTGLAVYRHRAFPRRYRNGVFTECWTLGRVYFVECEPAGASLRGRAEVFLETKDELGFAPVDLAVAPDGDLLVAIGGRGTQGGVFRVRWTGDDGAEDVVGPRSAPIDAVLRAPEPLSSWSRAEWMSRARQLGRSAFVDAAADAIRTSDDRVRAIEIATELFGGLNDADASRIAAIDDEATRARLCWSLGRASDDGTVAPLLAALTHDPSLIVQRAAWEALANAPPLDSAKFEARVVPDWSAALETPVRRVRNAAIRAARGAWREAYDNHVAALGDGASHRLQMSRLRVSRPANVRDDGWSDRAAEASLSILRETDEPDVRLEAMRLVHWALGDIELAPSNDEQYPGYVPRELENVHRDVRGRLVAALLAKFPSGNAELDRETGRTLALLEAADGAAIDAVCRMWTAESPPDDDVHYLVVASRLSGPISPDTARRIAAAFAGLDAKLARERRFPSRFWPLCVERMFDALSRREHSIVEALVGDPAFARPEQGRFVERLEGEQRKRAARQLLSRVMAVEAEAHELPTWTAEFVQAMNLLDDGELLPALRSHWDDLGLRDAIVMRLAERPQALDYEVFVASLASLDPEVVRASAAALKELSASSAVRAVSDEDMALALAALRAACLAGDREAAARQSTAAPSRDAHFATRAAIAALFATWTGADFTIDETQAKSLLAAYEPWFRWFAEHRPAVAQIAGGAGNSWSERTKRIAWDDGDAQRGRSVFEKQQCHRCHAGPSRLGPDLAGVAARFNREDLFAAIVEPSREIAPPYRTQMVVTRAGRVYHGLPVYDSPEGKLLLTGPDAIVRITGDELETELPGQQSLMPTGLLDALSNSEVADLYAYLRTLTTTR